MMRPQPYFRLLSRLAPQWQLLSLALLAMLVIATALASLPILIKFLFDSTFLQKDLPHIQMTSLAIILLFIVRGVASYVSNYSVGKASSQLGIDLRMDIFNKLLNLPISHYLHFKSDDASILISRTHQITHGIATNINTLVQNCLTIVSLIVCILYLSQELFLLLLLVSPLVILIMRMAHDHLSKFNSRNSSAANSLAQHLLWSIKHYREIRLNGNQDYESQRLSKTAEAIYRAEMQRISARAAIIPLGETITAMILVAVFYFISQQTLNNALSPDTVAALVAAALLLINPIQRIANLPGQLQHDQQHIEAVLLFLDQTSEPDTGTQNIKHIYGKLVFEQVRFCNSRLAKPILSHINLVIKPGEVIVFTGYTETEKNALIDLTLRLQQPTDGRILLDDYLLTDISINNLHANIAIVTKDSVLLDEKVAGNIAYGAMKCANEAKITTAAQISHAMEFIREMPEGLQTDINKEGKKITTKQRQQMAIARALLKDSPILILDEMPEVGESGPDNMFEVLEKLMQNRTTLIFNRHIPHLNKIDRIIVLENGCIIENLTNPKDLA
jgi:subfamily B ATP-binding cassette protein MsbA